MPTITLNVDGTIDRAEIKQSASGTVEATLTEGVPFDYSPYYSTSRLYIHYVNDSGDLVSFDVTPTEEGAPGMGAAYIVTTLSTVFDGTSDYVIDMVMVDGTGAPEPEPEPEPEPDMKVTFTSNVTDTNILNQIDLNITDNSGLVFNVEQTLVNSGFYDPEQFWIPATISRITTTNPDINIISIGMTPDDSNFNWSAYSAAGDVGFESINEVWNTTSYTIHVEIESEGPTLSPYNQLFVVDAAKIVEFGNVHVIIPTGSGEPPESINNTDYVINLLRIPFEIPAEFIGSNANIFLGGLNTEVDAPRLIVELVTVPVGSITVGDLYGNSLDFVSVDYELVLPHVAEPVLIEPHYVVGKTLTIEYVIDAYSGDSTVNIFNGGDLPFKSVGVELGRVVPFKTGGGGGESNQVGDSSGLDNGVTIAYVRALRRDFLSGDYSNLSTQYGLLSDFSGYVEVENIELSLQCTSGEKDAIRQALQSGVIINE